MAVADPDPAPFVRLDVRVVLASSDLAVASADVLVPGGGGQGCQVTPTSTLTKVQCQFPNMTEGTSILRIGAPIGSISLVSAEVSGFVKEPEGSQGNNVDTWLPP